ncbi:MAG: DMT family transporter, partial [Alphaproteobacteria bacterium]
ALVWQTPDAGMLLWLLGLALGSAIGHVCVTRAFAAAEASAVAPFDFLRLPFFALVGFLAFGEVPDAWTVAGAGVIIASSAYIARREAVLAARARAATAIAGSRSSARSPGEDAEGAPRAGEARQ